MAERNQVRRRSSEIHHLQAVQTALDRSRILNQRPTFETFSPSIKYTTSAVQDAVKLAAAYLRDDEATKHASAETKIRIDLQFLGPHLIAMGNLLVYLAIALGRTYGEKDMEHWRAIIVTLYETLGSSPFANSSAINLHGVIVPSFHTRIAAKGIDLTDTGFVFSRGQTKLAAKRNGALSLLIDYMVLACQQCHLASQRRARFMRILYSWVERLRRWDEAITNR